jgi:hypothetical protein
MNDKLPPTILTLCMTSELILRQVLEMLKKKSVDSSNYFKKQLNTIMIMTFSNAPFPKS